MRHTENMTGHYMHSGMYVEPLDLQPDMVMVGDIAHHLGNLCRFVGGTAPFHSVAEHSIHVSRLLAPDPALELWGLMHDAPEAYLGDWPRPLKRGAYIGKLYRAAEARAMLAIADALDLPILTDAEIERLHNADLVALATEKRDLLPALRNVEWDVLDGVEPAKQRILQPMDGRQAKAAFLRTYDRLTGELARKEAA